MAATETRNRGFTLLDATALVSATALGLLSAGLSIGMIEPHLRQVSWERLNDSSYVYYLLRQTRLGPAIASWLPVPMIFLLVFYSGTLLGLRLLPPRPPARDLARQPGLWACAAATLAAVLMIWLPFHRPVIIPAAIGLAWLGLAVSGRWSPEGSWLDRMGIALGLSWLAMLPPFAWFAWTD